MSTLIGRPYTINLLRRSSKKQAKIDKRKATRQEHVLIWLNSLERKSKCLYAVNITEPSVKGVHI